MRLIVDGYNVIHKLPQLGRQQDQRTALANFLAAWKQQVHYQGTISIVFDSRKPVYGAGPDNPAGVRCLYAQDGRSADDQIVAMVRNSAQAKGTLVVSDDNYVANNCRAHGARVEPVAYLLKPPKKRTAGDDKELDEKAKSRINESLKKEWNL